MGSRQRPRWGTGPAPTHRDVEVLAWVAEQYAVRADTLGLLLGRLSPDAPPTVHRWEYAPGRWAQHLHAVAVVRLAIEAANPKAEWVSERALARLRAQRRETWWRPDGGLVVADVAVSGSCVPLHTLEVELTPKHLAKLEQVFEHRYPGEVQTTYFTPAGHQDGLQRRLAVLEQATRARNEPWSQVNVVPLPEPPGVSYEGAA
jgi:hypothetical protein